MSPRASVGTAVRVWTSNCTMDTTVITYVHVSLIAGVDYIAVNQLLTFPAGAAVDNRQCFLVQTAENSTPEPDESRQLTLTSGSPSFLAVQNGRVTATVIIQDNIGMCHLSVSTM